MAVPQSDIVALLQETPLSASEVLQLLRLTRDQLLYYMNRGEAITYLEIRNRRVQVTDPTNLLKELNKMIGEYEDILAATNPQMSRRNVASFHRR